MIPDLGLYTVEVLTAYGLSLALLIGLTAVSVRRARKIRAQLTEVEARKERTR